MSLDTELDGVLLESDFSDSEEESGTLILPDLGGRSNDNSNVITEEEFRLN